MGLTTLTSCCCGCDDTTYFIIDKVCPCFSGFIVSGLTADTTYSVAIRTAKDTYYRDFVSNGSGVLQIETSSYPDSLINRWAGQYILAIEGVTFESEGYTGFTFFVSDCTDSGYVTIDQTPNE